MTPSEQVSNDFEATAINAIQNQLYADNVRTTATNHANAMATWASTLGDLYADVRDHFLPGGGLHEAFLTAHYTHADNAEALGNAGLQTNQIFQEADSAGAAGLAAAADGITPPATPEATPPATGTWA